MPLTHKGLLHTQSKRYLTTNNHQTRHHTAFRSCQLPQFTKHSQPPQQHSPPLGHHLPTLATCTTTQPIQFTSTNPVPTNSTATFPTTHLPSLLNNPYLSRRPHTPTRQQSTSLSIHSPLQTTQLRHFLGQLFEKQRRMSWILHRRKKMEMSADILSRPTYRPNRTESMDLIQKRIHDVTLGSATPKFDNFDAKKDQYGKYKYDLKTHTIDRSEILIPMNELLPKERLHVYWLKYKYHAGFAFTTYFGMWFAQFFTLIYKMIDDPSSKQKWMDMADMSSFQGLHHVIDTSPAVQVPLLAMFVTSQTDFLRIILCLSITALFWTKKGNKIALPPEYYNKIKYRYGLELPPPVEYDVSDIDPNLHAGLVNLPGTDPIPRGDFYGRDRQRDLIPKGRIDLEYVLHSWQRTNAVRRRREALTRRRKPVKRKITGPRWGKVGHGLFTRTTGS